MFVLKQTDVRTARGRFGWDQKTLAQRSGVDQSTISRIESGKLTNPTLATVTKLERALRLRKGERLVFGDQVRVAS